MNYIQLRRVIGSYLSFCYQQSIEDPALLVTFSKLYVSHRRYLFRRGRIRGRKPVLIILTDGISQDNVVPAATSLKRKGIEVFSLGIGKKFRRLQLQQMASSPSHVMTAGFRKLSTVLAALQYRACMPFVPRKNFFFLNLLKDF